MAVELLLARQGGVISRTQAIRAGISGAAVDRRVRTRRWRPLHPHVYLVAGHVPDDEALARAALLWAGDGAVLSGTAAAWWWGLVAEAPATLEVTLPLRRPARPGIALRYRGLAAPDRARHRGLSVTARGLTVLETAVTLTEPDAGLLLDRALRRGVGRADVLAAHARNPALVGPLLAAAAARSAADARDLLVGLLRGSGIRGWHRVPAGAGRATVAFPAARVAVDAVGWAGLEEATPGAWAGWSTLRFDRPTLTAAPGSVLAEIAAAVAGRDLRHARGPIDPSTGGIR